MKYLKTVTFLAAAAGLYGLEAWAQDSTTPPPPPPQPPQVCVENEKFSEWDFWVGDWNVYAKNPQNGEMVLAGTNSITKHYQNCLIKETWESAGGGGFSINYYNPNTDEWRQVWVSPNISIDYTGGLDDEGSMLLTGTIYYYANGQAFPFTGKWTLEDDGSVTQHFEQQNVETGEWVVWFTGYYYRKENDPNMKSD